jgi:hypothetical protein
MSFRAKVAIDLNPNRVEEWTLLQLLWSLSYSDPFQVVETLNPAQFPIVSLLRCDSFRPPQISLPTIDQRINFGDFEWFGFPDSLAIYGIPTVDYKKSLGFLLFHPAHRVKTLEEPEARRDHLTAEERFIVDRHKLFENGKVGGGVARRWQQCSEHTSLDQDERLSPLPVAAKCGKGLACASFPLFLRLSRDFLCWKNTFNQAWSILPGKGFNRH